MLTGTSFRFPHLTVKKLNLSVSRLSLTFFENFEIQHIQDFLSKGYKMRLIKRTNKRNDINYLSFDLFTFCLVHLR